MRLSLSRLKNIALTIITIPLTLSSLRLVFLVRLGGNIVNSSVFYSYSLIGKLPAFSDVFFDSPSKLSVCDK
jgi:hypothetical protein